MQLINAQGEKIVPGARLRALAGPESGTNWTYSHVVEHPIDGHRVHVTRRHPKLGHFHREFHPAVFGLEIHVDVCWKKVVRAKVHHVRTKVDDYLLAGLFALLPLAAFEHFHMSERLFEALGH